ncbi:MAG: hypothetical protein QXH07_03620 [Thermoplasmata archaeon]
MTTRCSILFATVEKPTARNRKKEVTKVQIYRYSDGYPHAVIPDLIQFYKSLQAKKSYVLQTYHDPIFEAGQFIHDTKSIYDYEIIEKPGSVNGSESYLWIVLWDLDKRPHEKYPYIYAADIPFPLKENYSFKTAKWHEYGSLDEAVKHCASDILPSKIANLKNIL